MNIFKISWNYLKDKPLSTLLSMILVALGVGLTSLLILLSEQFGDRLYKNIKGIDLVISAKGSPLQMILSSVYHVDVPTGNIPLKDSRWLKKNRYINKAIPLALGDSYERFRIVGTEQSYVEHYNAELAQGKLWEKDMEATIGSYVAKKTGLKIGDTFYGAHGMGDAVTHVHDDQLYYVVGITKPSNTVLDKLILTNVSSVWRVHEGHADHSHDDDHSGHNHDGHDHGHDHSGHNHDGHDHGHDHNGHNHDGHDHGHDHSGHNHDGHDHGHDHKTVNVPDFPPISEEGKDVTAYLVQYKRVTNKKTGEKHPSPMAFFSLKKAIDEHFTKLSYAEPNFELARLMDMTGVGTDTLFWLTLIIVIISAFSVFISLFNSMNERKYDVALMRVMGASRSKLFMMIIIEGVLIALIGCLIGLILSHTGMMIVSNQLEDAYQYEFSGLIFYLQELYILLGAIGLGFLSAIIPAFTAYNTDISNTLSK
ncbi:MAG: FtsX-like permease family protein [Saprospiraceae bacterium]|nr:FtsX-like permease family protein [Saprospiraceae bacterium]